MNRAAVTTQPVITFFCALLITVALTIAGCSASTLSGPDLAPSEEPTVQEVLPAAGPNAAHNEGKEAGKSGGETRTNGGGHN